MRNFPKSAAVTPRGALGRWVNNRILRSEVLGMGQSSGDRLQGSRTRRFSRNKILDCSITEKL